MMIVGYKKGNKVLWNDESGGFKTGIVRAKYYDPDQHEVSGHEIDIQILSETSTFVMESDSTSKNDIVVIENTEIFLRK